MIWSLKTLLSSAVLVLWSGLNSASFLIVIVQWLFGVYGVKVGSDDGPISMRDKFHNVGV